MGSEPGRWGRWLQRLLAAFFGFCLPGLGQLYNRQPRRALFFFLGNVLGPAFWYGLSYVGPLWTSLSPSAIFGIAVAVWVAWSVVAAIDGFRNAADRWSRPYRSYATVFACVVWLLLFRFAVYGPLDGGDYRSVALYDLPSGSMQPTAAANDMVIGVNWIYHSRLPDRGDIVAFGTGDGRHYLKRVIGLPGDRIEYRAGSLWLNGKSVARESLGEVSIAERGGDARMFQLYRETLPDGRSYRILELSDHEFLDNTDVFEVPPGHVFTLGDNRDQSQDSRVLSEIGFIPREHLIALMLYRSPDDPRSISWVLPLDE